MFWSALAYVLIGGVGMGTLLTLLFLPALYALWYRVGSVETAATTAQPRTSIPLFDEISVARPSGGWASDPALDRDLVDRFGSATRAERDAPASVMARSAPEPVRDMPASRGGLRARIMAATAALSSASETEIQPGPRRAA